MQRFLDRHSYRGRVPAAELLARLRRQLVSGASGTTAGKSRSALAFADLLELLNAKRDELDRAVAAVLARHPDAELFLSFPGVATLTAATLLAEIGEDRGRFPEPAMLLAEAGLAPVTRRSGASSRVRFRLAANHHLRDAFTWWAFNHSRARPGYVRDTTTHAPAGCAHTAPSAASAHAGRACSGAAGRTPSPTTPSDTGGARPHSTSRSGGSRSRAGPLHGPAPPPGTPALRSNLTWGVCTVHFVRNMHQHCRPAQRSLVSAALREVFNADSREQARERLSELLERLAPVVPKVCALLEQAEEDLLAFYGFPADH